MKQNHTRAYLALLLLCALLFTFGCGKTPEPPLSTPAPEPTAAPVAATPLPTDAVPEVTIDAATKEGLFAMMPVYDSLMRAMRDMPPEWQNYDSQSPEFFWGTLYYLCVNFCSEDAGNSLDAEMIRLKVPRARMEEYASACFGDFSGLLDLPADAYGIEYDPTESVYFLPLSDKGEDYAEPQSAMLNEYDSYDVLTAWLVDDEEYPDLLGLYSFIVEPNQYAVESNITKPTFPYSVYYAYEYRETVLVKDVYEKDGNFYAVLDHVDKQFHSALDLDENGKPYGYDWEGYINVEEENDEMLLSRTAEFTFDDMNLLFEDLNMEDALANTIAFFAKNAKLEYEGEHLMFYVNRYNGVLYSGSFAADYYFVG